MEVGNNDAPSTMLRMVPLARFAGEDKGRGRPQRRSSPIYGGGGPRRGGGGISFTWGELSQ